MVPASKEQYSNAVYNVARDQSFSLEIHTLVKILAPSENPMPNNGRFGNIFLSHLIVYMFHSDSLEMVQF